MSSPDQQAYEGYIAAGRRAAYDDSIQLLDEEQAKAKERGDDVTAELIDILRAKLKARALKYS